MDQRQMRLQGQELSKIDMKGKSLKEMEASIREAKARAEAAYKAGKDVPAKPVAAPPKGKDKLKREQILRRNEEKAKQAERQQVRKKSVEPKPKPKATTKPTPAAAKPTTKPKPVTKPRSGGSRMPSSSRSPQRTPERSPLSPSNRDSGMYGAIERRTNEAIPDMLGTSPFTLRLAD